MLQAPSDGYIPHDSYLVSRHGDGVPGARDGYAAADADVDDAHGRARVAGYPGDGGAAHAAGYSSTSPTSRMVDDGGGDMYRPPGPKGERLAEWVMSIIAQQGGRVIGANLGSALASSNGSLYKNIKGKTHGVIGVFCTAANLTTTTSQAERETCKIQRVCACAVSSQRGTAA